MAPDEAIVIVMVSVMEDASAAMRVSIGTTAAPQKGQPDGLPPSTSATAARQVQRDFSANSKW